MQMLSLQRGITVSGSAICHSIWTLQSETGRDTGLIQDLLLW